MLSYVAFILTVLFKRTVCDCDSRFWCTQNLYCLCTKCILSFHTSFWYWCFVFQTKQITDCLLCKVDHTLTLYFLVLNVLLLYLSLGFGIDVLLHRITLTLPLVHWFQLRLLLVNWEYLVDSLSGIMLVIIALISLNVNVYSVDLLDKDTHQEQFLWLLAIFGIWITVFVMSNNLIVLFFCWELVGLCSYLLISFWKERQQSVKCSFKAILYNKVGDIGLLLSFGCTLEVSRSIDLALGITLLP